MRVGVWGLKGGDGGRGKAGYLGGDPLSRASFEELSKNSGEIVGGFFQGPVAKGFVEMGQGKGNKGLAQVPECENIFADLVIDGRLEIGGVVSSALPEGLDANPQGDFYGCHRLGCEFEKGRVVGKVRVPVQTVGIELGFHLRNFFATFFGQKVLLDFWVPLEFGGGL